MNDNSNIPQLSYFSAIDNHELQEDMVLSALQAIETALLLIAADKWPTVITLLFESAEKLLKTLVPSEKKGDDKNNQETARRLDNGAEQLIKRYAKKYHLSNVAKKDANDFRRMRNHIAHHGYSPRDDAMIVQHVFQVAMPFLDHIFETKFEKGSVFELAGKAQGQAWVADTFHKTSKIVERKVLQGDDNFLAALLPLQLIFSRIANTGQAHNAITEFNNLLHLLQEEHQDIDYMLKRKLYFQFLEDLKDAIKNTNYSILLNIPDEYCLKCHDEKIIGAVTFDENDKFLRVDAFGCFHCEWKIWDRQVCDIFINQVLNSTQISALEDNKRPSADDNPPLSI